MNTLTATLMGLGLASASGHDNLRRRLAGASLDHWETELYFLNDGGVGSGRCELGFQHQIFNREECEFAVKDLGYEVKTTTTLNAWSKVCGCSFNPTTGHLQFNQFAHPEYCYETAADKHKGAMPAQDKNSKDEGLIALCYHKDLDKQWTRKESSQCFVGSKQFNDDRLDNPIFNGGGFIGTMSRIQCMDECRKRKDPRGRPCVAIEMSTHSTNPNTPARCALAWGCDFVKPWGGGDVYMMPEVGPVDTPPDYNVDNYYLNGDGIGSGRCEDGFNTQIFHAKECEYAIESLGYEVKTSTTVNAWSAVCGCSFDAETGHMQFNQFAHPEYCYETPADKHKGAMPAQDRNSRENRLVAVCYAKPEFNPRAHPGVTRGNLYLNLPGVGSGRCERGFDDQIRNLHDCLDAATQLGYDADTIFILNSWGAVCGCSVNPETNHVQFNKFSHPQYCYETEAEKHAGSMPAQDRNSRVERLIAVCQHSGEPTSEPTAQPTATPSAIPTASPSATPTADPTATPSAVPTADPSATPSAIPTAAPSAIPTADPTATPSAIPTADPTATPSATPTATPTAVPTADPTAAGRVVLYSGDGFDGSEWAFTSLGDYAATLGDFKNDVVSSMIVEGDFKATVYVHCPKDVGSVQRADLRKLEEYCMTAGGDSMTLTAGRYVGKEMGIPINTMSYLRIEEQFKVTITARGDTGSELVKFVVGDEEKTVTLSTTNQDYTFEQPENGEFSVFFLNDNGARNVRLTISVPTDVTTSRFPGWNCGASNENIRCQYVRDGVLAWTGEYKYTITE